VSTAPPDWLGASRAAADELRQILAASPTTIQRARETGTTGMGGDRTLEIDAEAEAAVFRQLERLHDDGARFTAISEERGVVGFGDPDLLVVIDPIDGSTNAKRGVTHHALSIAVAEGPTMADVTFAFVQDFGPNEEWVAHRGGGAFLDGTRLDPTLEEHRWRGKLELVGCESADPRWIGAAAAGLSEHVHRLRAIGAIAVSLCQVGAARFDGMVALRPCRAVDVAAAQLIVREGGGLVDFIGYTDPLAAPLDLEPHSPVVAARTAEALAQLATIPPT
jgi:myo-inositol-1(or 4)-monophosphatase